MRIKNNFVSYKTAKKLLKLGFNSECFAGYDMENHKELFVGFDEYDGEIFNREYYIPAPLYQQVLQWLREIHNINIIINYDYSYSMDKEYYSYRIRRLDSDKFIQETFGETYNTYKQAIQEGINQALSSIENDNNRS